MDSKCYLDYRGAHNTLQLDHSAHQLNYLKKKKYIYIYVYISDLLLF